MDDLQEEASKRGVEIWELMEILDKEKKKARGDASSQSEGGHEEEEGEDEGSHRCLQETDEVS